MIADEDTCSEKEEREQSTQARRRVSRGLLTLLRRSLPPLLLCHRRWSTRRDAGFGRWTSEDLTIDAVIIIVVVVVVVLVPAVALAFILTRSCGQMPPLLFTTLAILVADQEKGAG